MILVGIDGPGIVGQMVVTLASSGKVEVSAKEGEGALDGLQVVPDAAEDRDLARGVELGQHMYCAHVEAATRAPQGDYQCAA